MSTTYYYLIAFMSAVFILYTALPKKIKWTALFVSGLAFAYMLSGFLVLYMLLSGLSVYGIALLIGAYTKKTDAVRKSLPKEERKAYKEKVSRNKKWLCFLAIAVNFGILLVLKYGAFFVDTFNTVTRLSLPLPKFAVPLGISYYTLQATGYVVDVSRGKYEADKNPFRVLLFVSYFPQLTEGPIGRYDLLANRLYEGHPFDYHDFTYGLQKVLFGAFKKFVIADRANMLVSTVFKNWEDYSGFAVVLGVLLFTLQLYGEFSGFIDIVSGISEMFGIHLSENFERPFFSKTVSEFWRRWHITLGSWTRDYIFYPVSFSKPFVKLSKWTSEKMNRYYGSVVPNAAALLVVWLFTGLWHGASMKYVVYGLYYYLIMLIGLLAEPLFKILREKLKITDETRWYNALRILRTLVFINIGMLIFKANDLSQAFRMLASVFSAEKSAGILSLGLPLSEWIVLLFATAILFVIGLLEEKKINLRDLIASRKLPVRWLVWSAFFLFVVIFGAYGPGYGAVDPIYAQF